jgi:hypothetical protein
MRFAPGVRPTPMPAAPMTGGPRSAPMPMAGTRPGVTTAGPKPAPMPMANPRGIGPAPMTGGPKPMPMMKKGGKVSSASKRADGCAIKGKTKGRMV